MKLTGALLLAAVGLATSSSVHAADPAKVDYSERNTPYAPTPSVSPDRRSPTLNPTLQNRRVSPTVIDRTNAAVGSREAAIDMTETKAKNIVTPDSRRPAAPPPELSTFDHRKSRFQPGAAHEAQKLAPRYQSAIASARVVSVNSSPAVAAGTTARVNRFVFHRNTATPLGTVGAVTPAGGSTGARPSLRATP